MPAHWEWLWQLVRREVAPTHLTYLTDRMVFTAGAIAELMEIVDREPDRVLSYRHDRVEDMTTPVELVQSQWTGQLLELDARKLIEMSSRAGYGDHLPRMLNSIAPVATLTAIEERFGNVFRSISPDYCFAFRCLATRDTILYLDRSCLIQWGMSRSSGITYMAGRPNEDAARFKAELSVPRFGSTPEPAFETATNAIFQEYCAIREEVGGDRFPPVDWRSYLTDNAISIDRVEDPEWRTRNQALLRRRGWTRVNSARHVLRQSASMAAYFIRHPQALGRSLKRQLWDRPPGTPAAFLLPRVGLNPRIRDELRFDSAAKAIAYANAHPRARTRYAWHLHQLRRAGAIVRELPATPRPNEPQRRSGAPEVSSRPEAL
jgi:hypothetical protein